MKVEFSGLKVGLTFKHVVKISVFETLKFLGQDKSLGVSVSFVDEDEIRRLNKDFRNLDKVTDVLSFPSFNVSPFEKIDVSSSENNLFKSNDVIFIGDMALCLPVIFKQAKEYNEPQNKVLARLVIHSALHLLGFDHVQDEDFEVMEPVQEKILKKVMKNK